MFSANYLKSYLACSLFSRVTSCHVKNTKIKKVNGLLIDFDSFRLLFTKIWAPLTRFSTDEFWKKLWNFSSILENNIRRLKMTSHKQAQFIIFFSFAAKQKAAVTRIRTWVITATTWGTNHYTITARCITHIKIFRIKFSKFSISFKIYFMNNNNQIIN